jgi:hypothetical protein
VSFKQFAKDWNIKSWFLLHIPMGCLMPTAVWLFPHVWLPLVMSLILGIWAEQAQGHIQGDRIFIDWGKKRWVDVATYVGGGLMGTILMLIVRASRA